jgi:aspartate aminotransferase
LKRLSYVANQLEGQAMFSILEEAKELEKLGRPILHFELGDPDFRTPVDIAGTAMGAIMNGDTHYAPSGGLLELKEAAQEVTLKSRKFKPDLNQLLVTAGANVQIYYAIACTINPGDEVIVPDPGFVSYYSILKLVGAKIIRVQLKEKNGFRLNQYDVEKAISPNTKMIIMNSPSNPTGAVMSAYEISEMYRLAKKHDLYLLSDEIYARMTYDAKHYSPSTFDKCKERVILVNGFSKSYAMTGWRLGVCTGPSHLIDKMRLMLETTSSCVSPFIQRAGIAALKSSLGNTMMKEYEERRNIMVDGLNSLPGITCLKPNGAFYVFPNIEGTGMDCETFAERMLCFANIALAPGTIFGEHGKGHVRLCYANSKENILQAIERMRKVL